MPQALTTNGRKLVVIADLRGGMNSADPPLSLPENQCVEALNVDWYDGLIGRRRNGASSLSLTGGTAFVGPMDTIIRHVPGGEDAAAELWGFDSNSPTLVKRLAGGTAWADVTMSDNIATSPIQVYGASFNGKLYLAFDTAGDRLHCYDPSLASPQVRRVGLAVSTAPTVANNGVGAYAAVARFYKQDTIQLDSTRVVRRSELSAASTTFTPSGAGLSARVTRGAFPGEGETHWRVWGSADNTTYYNISGNIAIGTTTYDDTATVTTYSTNTVQEPVGTFTLWTSVKYIVTDGNRLLGANAWETGNRTSRIYFSPVLGTLDQGDDERTRNTTFQKDYLDLNENDGGAITGLGIMSATPIAFKYRQTFKLVPTGDVTAPYLAKRQSARIGCVSAKTIVLAEDERGREALYWLSHKGPYRFGADGLQYLGRDNEDVWSTVNLDATNITAHAVYHEDIHQVWFWIATSTSNDPDTKMVFDVLLGHPDEKNRVRGGWAKHTGSSAAARCSVSFAKTVAASMSRSLKPYVGLATGTSILKCDDTTVATDAGTGFEGRITTRPIHPTSTLGFNLGVGSVHMIAKVSSASNLIACRMIRDWGLETTTLTQAQVGLGASGSETRVLRKFGRPQMSGAGVVQLQFTDSVGVVSQWVIDALAAPLDIQEPR